MPDFCHFVTLTFERRKVVLNEFTVFEGFMFCAAVIHQV